MSPARIWPIVTTPLLSPLGKLRLGWEYFTPARRDVSDESLESFVVRRFGREAFDRLIQPLIGGIYTADPAKLSVAATLPQFLEMERKSGSLIRGMRGQRSEVRGQRTEDRGHGAGARYGLFVAPREGMQRLVDAVAARLSMQSVRLNAPIERIDRANDQWHLAIRGDRESFDEMVLATPGAVSSRLLQGIDNELASLINKIEYAGCSVALLGVRREQIARLPPCFGFVVPAIEKRRIIAGSFASVKFPGRAPEGNLLIRVFVGGALEPDIGRLPDDEIRNIVLQELRELIGLTGEPEFCEVARWLEHMPQYHVGHLNLVRQIEERAATIPHFALAGNAYRGVGIPFCIRSGEQAAERLIQTAAAVTTTSNGAAARASSPAAAVDS
jgi:oxygen-dependent protoporphyrinogen oxidase